MKISNSFSRENHWSSRPWLAVENDPDERTGDIRIYTDTQQLVCRVPVGRYAESHNYFPTEDDRQLANHIITLHNNALGKAGI